MKTFYRRFRAQGGVYSLLAGSARQVNSQFLDLRSVLEILKIVTEGADARVVGEMVEAVKSLKLGKV